MCAKYFLWLQIKETTKERSHAYDGNAPTKGKVWGHSLNTLVSIYCIGHYNCMLHMQWICCAHTIFSEQLLASVLWLYSVVTWLIWVVRQIIFLNANQELLFLYHYFFFLQIRFCYSILILGEGGFSFSYTAGLNVRCYALPVSSLKTT